MPMLVKQSYFKGKFHPPKQIFMQIIQKQYT